MRDVIFQYQHCATLNSLYCATCKHSTQHLVSYVSQSSYTADFIRCFGCKTERNADDDIKRDVRRKNENPYR